METNEFPQEAFKELGNYVYRLIDPRNGETFYVGRGIRNKVSPMRMLPTAMLMIVPPTPSCGLSAIYGHVA